MPITFGGFATGLDTNAIISAFVKAEHIPIDRLAKQKSDVEAASQSISSISTKLSALRDAASALADPAKFAAMAVTSSDTAVAATTTVGATPGRYDVTVTQIAKEQRSYSTTQASGTDALGMSGNLSIQVGAGTAVDVTVEAGDSLSALAAKINASGARVAANVLFDGTSYRLGVRGLDTGLANAVTFDQTGFDLGFAATPVQQAQDAVLKVDTITVSRATNQVSGVIQGVTLALTRPTTTPAVIEVASDAAKLKDKINAFVNAYNDVVKASQAATGYGSQKATNSILSGDSTLRGMLDRLARTVGSPVAGTTGAYDTLMSVGIASTKDGLLRFDETKLATALTASATAVAKLFTKDAALGSTGAFDSLRTAIDFLNSTAKSPLRTRIDSLQAQSVRIADSMDTLQRRVDSYEEMLRRQFSQLEATVSQYQSAGRTTGGSTSGSGSSSGTSG